MKQKKEFRYHLKKDVRFALVYLAIRINYLIEHDEVGFNSIPSFSILPAFFKVYSHLLWNRTLDTWFKKVYE